MRKSLRGRNIPFASIFADLRLCLSSRNVSTWMQLAPKSFPVASAQRQRTCETAALFPDRYELFVESRDVHRTSPQERPRWILNQILRDHKQSRDPRGRKGRKRVIPSRVEVHLA